MTYSPFFIPPLTLPLNTNSSVHCSASCLFFSPQQHILEFLLTQDVKDILLVPFHRKEML